MEKDNKQFPIAGDIRYELTEDEVMHLYYTEPRLSALIEMDVIKLIDQHLVVNLKEFITPKTHHLTAVAKRNKPACCVGVRYVSLSNRSAHKKKAISCTLDILLQSANFLENGEPAKGNQTAEEQKKEATLINNEIERVNKLNRKLPGGFSDALKYLMKEKGYTEELLAQESWVSLSTIKQYRQDEEKEKTLRTVTALCIGLHLHPWTTEKMLTKAGITPKSTRQDGAYRFLYTYHYKDSIEDCNVYLKSQGIPEFKVREKKR